MGWLRSFGLHKCFEAAICHSTGILKHASKLGEETGNIGKREYRFEDVFPGFFLTGLDQSMSSAESSCRRRSCGREQLRTDVAIVKQSGQNAGL